MENKELWNKQITKIKPIGAEREFCLQVMEQAIELDLRPSHNEAHLYRKNKELVFHIGYMGIIKTLAKQGYTVRGGCVEKGDKYFFNDGTAPFFMHSYDAEKGRVGWENALFFYVLIEKNSVCKQVLTITKEEIDYYNAGGEVWGYAPTEMAIIYTIRRCHYLMPPDIAWILALSKTYEAKEIKRNSILRKKNAL